MTQAEYEAHVVETANEDIERLQRKFDEAHINLGKTLEGIDKMTNERDAYVNEIISYQREIERLKNKIELYKP